MRYPPRPWPEDVPRRDLPEWFGLAFLRQGILGMITGRMERERRRRGRS